MLIILPKRSSNRIMSRNSNLKQHNQNRNATPYSKKFLNFKRRIQVLVKLVWNSKNFRSSIVIFKANWLSKKVRWKICSRLTITSKTLQFQNLNTSRILWVKKQKKSNKKETLTKPSTTNRLKDSQHKIVLWRLILKNPSKETMSCSNALNRCKKVKKASMLSLEPCCCR